MTKIRLIMPYFGTWPEWFPFFLESCKDNPTVSWLFFSESPAPPGNVPDNVSFQPMTLPQLRDLASHKLGIDVALEYPFKVCDFRPAYAQIFNEHLEGFDFWGWGDIDVVYGNLRKFLTNAVLRRNDVISCRSGFLAGEFTVLRNSASVNSLYQKSRDYRMIFSDRRGFDFEEFGFFRDRKVDSMTHVVRRFMKEGDLRGLFFDFGNNDRVQRRTTFSYQFNNGQLLDLLTGEELLLYHFLDAKRAESFRVTSAAKCDRSIFLITQDGITGLGRALPAKSGLLRTGLAKIVRRARSCRRNISATIRARSS